MRERSELLQLDFQGYPLFKQVLQKDKLTVTLFSHQREKSHEGSRTQPAYLQLLLQFAVKSRQHCVRLLVSSDRSLNRLLVLSYWPKRHKRTVFTKNVTHTRFTTSLLCLTNQDFLPGDGGLSGQDGSDDVWFLRTVLLVLWSEFIFRL